MHDPKTVAFEIRSPWKSRRGVVLRRARLMTIWHVDPERGGSDNSCDWFGSRRRLSRRERAIMEAVWNLQTVIENEMRPLCGAMIAAGGGFSAR